MTVTQVKLGRPPNKGTRQARRSILISCYLNREEEEMLETLRSRLATEHYTPGKSDILRIGLKELYGK